MNYDVTANIFKAISAAVLVITAIGFLALFVGARRRGGGATALGIVGLLLSLPSAIWVVAINFSRGSDWYNEDWYDWVNSGTAVLSTLGFALIVLGLLIAKSSAPRPGHFAAPPGQQHLPGQPPPPPGQYAGYR